MEERDERNREMRRITAVLAIGAVVLGGAALGACGDDKEGPAEDVGGAIDEAGGKAVDELKKAGKDAERELDDGKRD